MRRSTNGLGIGTPDATEAVAGSRPLRPSDAPDLAAELVGSLHALGVQSCYGVCGGAISRIWAALLASEVDTLHFRHESGAAFAACERSIAGGQPVGIFVTSGPGLTNVITGLATARSEGAHVVLLSPLTSAAQRGRGAAQETGRLGCDPADLGRPGWLVDLAVALESPDELDELLVRLRSGFARPEGFVAHIAVPVSLQGRAVAVPPCRPRLTIAAAGPDERVVDDIARVLAAAPFALLAGWGARGCADLVRELAERTGAVVLCSPRAKGVFPERGAQFGGVTGMGGHDAVLELMRSERAPARMLVLGSRLGEPTSGFDAALVPRDGLIHVDVDPRIPGVAFPGTPTLAVQSEIGAFLRSLLARPLVRHELPATPAPSAGDVLAACEPGRVHPRALMAALQDVIVDGSDLPVIAEPSSAMAWGAHLLRFDRPGRWRVSNGFGAMGHAVGGVIGLALAHGGRAVAITGDGSALMHDELSTAVRYGVAVVLVVLNDACYGLPAHGMRLIGQRHCDAAIPRVDFAARARSVGAAGIRVEHAEELEGALRTAVESDGPCVVDVLVDERPIPPIGSRVRAIAAQYAGGRGSRS